MDAVETTQQQQQQNQASKSEKRASRSPSIEQQIAEEMEKGKSSVVGEDESSSAEPSPRPSHPTAPNPTALVPSAPAAAPDAEFLMAQIVDDNGLRASAPVNVDPSAVKNKRVGYDC